MTPLRRFWLRLTSDRKRFGVLCAALAVGMLLWARLIVLTNIPRTAVADDEAKPRVNSATVQRGSQSRGVTGSSDQRAVTRRVEGRSENPIEVRLSLAPDRDPFVISTTHFPKPVIEIEPTQTSGKSGPRLAEDQTRAAEARHLARLQQIVRSMRLEAVMSSVDLTPMVVINGRTYRTGDTIAVPGEETISFTLKEVIAGGVGGVGGPGARRSVVLEHDGHQFELTMAGPGGM